MLGSLRGSPGGAPDGRGEASARPRRPCFPEGLEIAPGRHLLRPLGGGTRYEVHLVWDDVRFALLVAKVLRPGLARDPRARAELLREADLLERVAHPSIVRGFGAHLDVPHPHLLLESVEGPSLHRVVRRHGPLADVQLLPLALHLLAALVQMEGHGVVHLDVKPANVLLSVPPRLVDLSVARTLAEAGALRRPVGTDGYMAPEQCAPEALGPVGCPADVWGAGATLFEATTGRRPFPRPRGAESAADPAVRFPQLSAAGPPPLPPGVPPPLAATIAAMLSRDPARRPRAREAAEALWPLAAEVPERLVPTRRGLVPPR